MKIFTVGCGNAFSYINYNQSFLLEDTDDLGNTRRMLIDCGTRVPLALHEHHIDIKTITDVFVSHSHSDHCGGLEELAFLRYDWKNRPTDCRDSDSNYAPTLIANEILLSDLWKNTLSGGLRSMEGFDASIYTYFKPMPVKANKTFMWCNWRCSLIQQIHVMTGSMVMNTFGLFMEHTGSKRTVFFTTDAQYFQPEQVKVFYDKAQIIFQDCELIGVDTKNKVMNFKSGVHANYAQLAGWESVNAYKMDAQTKSKLWLSHYQDFKNSNKDMYENDVNWDDLAKQDGFAGFVTVGKIFEV